MWNFVHKLGSPISFYRFSGKLLPWISSFTLVLLLAGLSSGLVFAPADYQQGDAFRIMYVHVPAALLSLFIYANMAVNAVIVIIWRIKVAEIILKISASLGAWMTFIALVTGSIWGKPMWGTWWIWDARLTSELILLFLYLGILALMSAIKESAKGVKAASIMVLVGLVDIPIIHYSVYWWNTLHQGASISQLSKPTIAASMLYPLLLMIAAFFAFYFWQLLARGRAELLVRERNTQWVKKLLSNQCDA